MREELTLEQTIARETERLAKSITITEGFIVKLNARKALVKEQAEKDRLQSLVELHTARLEELNNTDATTAATQRFETTQQKVALRNQRLGGTPLIKK